MMRPPFFTIWQRYFYKEFLITLISILFGLYALYILVDVMAHLKIVAHKHTSWTTSCEYYLATFSKRLDILLPFSLLIAAIRTLFYFQQRGELVALLTSGISRKMLLRPLLNVAIFSTILLYVNYQWFMPQALPRIATIYESRFGKETLEDPTEILHEMILNDGSKLIYARYDPTNQEFHNVFWIQSANELFHMKRLNIATTVPVGKWIDQLVRDSSGSLQKINSQEQLLFSDMHFERETVQSSITPPRAQPLLKLFQQLLLYSQSNSVRGAEITAYFLYKLTLPLLCILVIIAVAPFCLRFQRTYPVLITYLLAIAALFSINLLFEAAFVMGKSELVSPYFAFCFPWICLCYLFGRKYQRL